MHRIRVSLVLLLLVSSIQASDWPQWRGPGNNGISEEKGLPVKWSGEENLLFKVKLPGWAGSTPVIVNDQIFLTSEDAKDIVLLCLDKNGKTVWKERIGDGGGFSARQDEGNRSAPSPSSDGKHIFAYSGSGELVCFTLEGKKVWTVDTQKEYGRFRIQFGMAMTPVLYENHIYLQLIHTGTAKVICLAKETGKEVWAVDRKSDGTAECEHSYASPCIWKQKDKAVLVVHGNDYTTGHELKDGKELWRVGNLNPKESYNRTLRFVASPVAHEQGLIIPTAKNGPVVFLGSMETANEQWRRSKETPDVPSPLLHDGLVYLCRENGALLVLEAETGKEIYQKRLHSARYRASPTYADGKIYCVARDGIISVVKAGKTFELLSENKMNDQIASSLAISNGRIYIRGYDSLYVVGAK